MKTFALVIVLASIFTITFPALAEKVLHQGAVDSPEKAVKAAIVSEVWKK